jgi:hypothetical protein
MAITVELPHELEETLSQEWPNLQERVLEALVVEGYRGGLISHGRVGELLGIGSTATDVLLLRHDALFSDAEDGIEQDIAASRRLSAVNRG